MGVFDRDGLGPIISPLAPSTGGGGGGTPGGADTQVQFNNSGAFGGSSTFTWDLATPKLRADAQINFTNSTPTQGAYSFARGQAAGGASFTVGQAAFASGYTNASGAYISASGLGAHAIGHADDGFISATGHGNCAIGSAFSGGAYLQALDNGTFVSGYAIGGSFISAAGGGSRALGVTTGAGALIESTGVASFTGGFNTAGEETYGAGQMSFTYGRGLTNSNFASVMFGRFATISAGSATTWVSTDPLLTLGNGASAGSRSNALELLKDGSLQLPKYGAGFSKFDGSGNISSVLGASGSFTTVDLKTVTVVDGLITSIV